MTTSSDFRKIAREKLSGNWGRSILVSFLAALLGGISGGGGSSGAGGSASTAQQNFEVTEEMVVILLIVGIIAIVMFFIGGAVELGHNKYYMDLIRYSTAGPVGTLFSYFNIFLKALGLRIVIMIKVLLWSLLLFVPGIIAAFRYSQAPYIMAEDPTISIGDAIKRSSDMMRGNKFRLFRLGLSFIGWAILAMLTFGIGFLWLTPYYSAAYTAFYLEVSNMNKAVA